MKIYDIAVIGGGASGMIAAIAAAHTDGELSIAIAERNARVGKKNPHHRQRQMQPDQHLYRYISISWRECRFRTHGARCGGL